MLCIKNVSSEMIQQAYLLAIILIFVPFEYLPD